MSNHIKVQIKVVHISNFISKDHIKQFKVYIKGSKAKVHEQGSNVKEAQPGSNVKEAQQGSNIKVQIGREHSNGIGNPNKERIKRKGNSHEEPLQQRSEYLYLIQMHKTMKGKSQR